MWLIALFKQVINNNLAGMFANLALTMNYSQIEEEEEIKRLRKELVPKALPMPCFDRPFAPRRSAILWFSIAIFALLKCFVLSSIK